jgi:aldose 1-epimerase
MFIQTKTCIFTASNYFTNTVMKKALIFLAAIPFMWSCGPQDEKAALPLIDPVAYQTTVDGKQVSLYTLTNAAGVTLQLTNYGCRMLALWVPDRDGVMRDVVWGYSTAADMLAGDTYAGPVVGRYGNRIANGRFTLDGVEYRLNINNGPNQLHGGPKGWATQVWDAVQTADNKVEMTLVSPDGDENYPGTVTIKVSYELSEENAVTLRYEATTDAPTVINPTSHAYFNLHGTADKSILSHVMMLNADAFTPTDEGLIPTGEIRPVEGTPLDFRTPTAIGERIDADYEPLVYGKGYDHNWVLNTTRTGTDAPLAAEVYEPATGIVMKVYTDQPGIQFYSGNFMDGSDKGKYGEVHNFRTGIALETQHFPDSPNHPEFPSTELRPGETYTQNTVYEFSTK